MPLELTLNPNLDVPEANAAWGVDDPSLVNLTPEGILMYCQNQLGSIDGDIKTYMDNQKAMLKKKEILATLKNEIATRTPPKNEAEITAIKDAYAAAYESMNAAFPGDPLLDVIGDSAAKIVDKWANSANPPEGMPTVGPDMTALQKIETLGDAIDKFNGYAGLDKEFYTGLADGIGETIEEIKGNAELQMIQLQSMVSARQTAVQLATNMLSKVDQTLQSVVSNIK